MKGRMAPVSKFTRKTKGVLCDGEIRPDGLVDGGGISFRRHTAIGRVART